MATTPTTAEVASAEVATNGTDATEIVEYTTFADIADDVKASPTRPSLADHVDKSVLIFPTPMRQEGYGKRGAYRTMTDVQMFDAQKKVPVGPRECIVIPERVVKQLERAFKLSKGRAILVKPIQQGRGISIS